MKNQKAFTIVELLTAVVILGVLSTLAIVGVGNVISNSHKKYNESQVKLLIAAAQTYYTDNKSLLPTLTFTQKKVTLQTLIDNNYIEPLVDYKKEPYDTQKSYAYVTRMAVGKYAYDGELVRKNGSSTKYKENANNNGKISITDNVSVNLLDNEVYTNNQKEILVEMEDPDTIAGYIITLYKGDKNIDDLEYKEVGNQTKVSTTVKLSKDKYPDGKYKLKVKLIDVYNNQKIVTTKNITLDTIAPKCSISVDGGTKRNGWYSDKEVKLKMTINDKDDSPTSCLTATQGCLSSGSTNKAYGKSISTTRKGDGSNINYYGESVDRAGNVGKCNITFNKDSTPPSTCNITVNGEEGKNDWYINNPPQITVTGADSANGSGIDSTQYKLNNKIGQTQSQTTSTAGTLWTGTVQDKAGNSSTCTTNVKYIAERPAIGFGLNNPSGNEVYYSSTGCIQYVVLSTAGIAGFTNLMPLYNSIDSTTNSPNYLAGGTMLAFGELRPDNYKCDWPFCYYYLYTHCANSASEHHFEVEDGAGQKAHASTKLTITKTSDGSKTDSTPQKPTKKTVKISYGGNVGTGNTIALYCTNNSTTDEDSTLSWKIDSSTGNYKLSTKMTTYDEGSQKVSNRGPKHFGLDTGFYYKIEATCKYGNATDTLTIDDLYCYSGSSVTNELTQTTNNCLVKKNCKDCSSYCAEKFFKLTLNDDMRKDNKCDCSFYHDPTKCPR